MSFGGSVAAMIATLKNNRLMLGERYTYFDAKKNYLRATKGMKITYREATKEELQLVREKIKKQKKTDRIRVGVVLLFVTPIIVIGVYQAISLSKEKISINNQRIKKKDIKKYQFYINDGDLMIQQKKWNNAIFRLNRQKGGYF